MGNYHWAKGTIRKGWLTVAELAAELRVSTWTARRWLTRSKLPATLYTRFWTSPKNGRVYRRRAWGMPPSTAEALWQWRLIWYAGAAQRVVRRIRARLRGSFRRAGGREMPAIMWPERDTDPAWRLTDLRPPWP
ncbi:MAG: hypothetical protein IH977_01750 [Nitrospinae bacterium]|nr:hypothetical protein [Nitrospinota bacterium]